MKQGAGIAVVWAINYLRRPACGRRRRASGGTRFGGGRGVEFGGIWGSFDFLEGVQYEKDKDG